MESAPQGSARARWKAVLLSLGLPGLGELYAGEQRSAALTLILWHVMLVFGVALVFLALPGPLIVLPFLLGIITWIVIAVRAARAAARAPQPYTLQPYNRWYWYGVAILFSLLVWQPTLLRYVKSHWSRRSRFLPRRWSRPFHLVSGDPQTYHPDMRNWGPIVVSRDSVFILGDNRDDSYDSRFWGALGADRVRGRPLYVYFSKSRDANMGFSIRWNRIGVRF